MKANSISKIWGRVFSAICFIITLTSANLSFSQSHQPKSPDEIKNLSIEELLNLEVTSVSRTPEALSEAASAIQVITSQDILRSAATTLPEVLRLATNLQVAQVNARHWIISARGFNAVYSNKLLVMIDGRTVYSPLFAGVFWDAQNVVLEDIDRIEIISGPGGTQWGANAVNGVINIITKNAGDTQGLYISAAGGTAVKVLAEARYGGKLASDISYRIYARHQENDSTAFSGNRPNPDDWRHSQTGFAINWEPSNVNNISLQGDFYTGKETANLMPSSIDGQNITGRWTHTFSENSNLIIQGYADRTWRIDVPATISDELYTYDVDMQHSFLMGAANRIIWGAGYRLMDDRTQNTTQFLGFVPQNRRLHLFSSFVQDEIQLVPKRLQLALGAKLQHNNYSGFELQPSARIAYTPVKRQIIWAAISRAVRAPSRADVDYRIPVFDVPPTQASIAGGPNFISEMVIAYELGYRVQPLTSISLSLAGFYNNYDDLFSVEPLPGTLTYQIQNGVKGYSYGAELAANYIINSKWRLRGGYSYFRKSLENKPGNMSDETALSNLGSDAKHRGLLQSVLNLPFKLQFDIVARYNHKLPKTQYEQAVESYFTADARLAKQFRHGLEISLNGLNLFDARHTEFGKFDIERSVYGKLSFRY